VALPALRREALHPPGDGHRPEDRDGVLCGVLAGRADPAEREEPMRVHTFGSTESAYDACQCDEAITDGDVLHIPSEGVVGLADTWPVAITVEHRELHTLRDGADVPSFLVDRDMTQDQLDFAVSLAQAHFYPVRPAFLKEPV
jgi:hypothetical protein